VLVNQEEFYFPNSRYASKRVLASLQIHSDGGGAPVSWDESHALLDLGKHLIHSRGGDLDEADELWFKPDNMIASIAYWLDETNALSLFLFTYFQPKWENEDLVARFTQILEALKEFASIEIDLTPDEIIRLTKFILNKFEYAKTLFDLLAVNQSLKTYRLTDLVEEAVNSGSPTSVTNLEFLVSELNQDENY
jgi:hypothetical protein